MTIDPERCSTATPSDSCPHPSMPSITASTAAQRSNGTRDASSPCASVTHASSSSAYMRASTRPAASASCGPSGAASIAARTASREMPRPAATSSSSAACRSSSTRPVASRFSADANVRVNCSPKDLYAPAATMSASTPSRSSTPPKKVSSAPSPTRATSPVRSKNTRSHALANHIAALPGDSTHAYTGRPARRSLAIASRRSWVAAQPPGGPSMRSNNAESVGSCAIRATRRASRARSATSATRVTCSSTTAAGPFWARRHACAASSSGIDAAAATNLEASPTIRPPGARSRVRREDKQPGPHRTPAASPRDEA